jgi:hypothetical protein
MKEVELISLYMKTSIKGYWQSVFQEYVIYIENPNKTAV